MVDIGFTLIGVGTFLVMWFESMHPGFQHLLRDQRHTLEILENRVGSLPNLTPPLENVMAAYGVDPVTIKVVILGQDPYPTRGVAIGHAFAVADAQPLPASLKNLATELASDVGGRLGSSTLENWRRQGVMLLNTSLTTVEGQSAAHSKLGWQGFTRSTLEALIASGQPLVLVLWGAHAQAALKPLQPLVEAHASSVRVLRGVHPSPLSAYRGFFGSRPFSQINSALVELGQSVIDWSGYAS